MSCNYEIDNHLFWDDNVGRLYKEIKELNDLNKLKEKILVVLIEYDEAIDELFELGQGEDL